jgi:hypothetical protein
VNIMKTTKTYMIVGIDTAMHLLRPGAKWEFTGGVGFTRWDDPRPCPSVEEVMETVEKIKAFEDSINTILLPEQKAAFEQQLEDIEKAYAA